MNGRQFAEHLGVAHGTVKRWLHEGMPAHRHNRRVRIDVQRATEWIREHYGRTIAFDRKAVVYFAIRSEGAVKIGWSSDVLRRVQELRKATRSPVELLACFAEVAEHLGSSDVASIGRSAA